MEKDKMIKEMAKDIPFLTLDREVFVGATEKRKVGWTLSEEDNKVIAEELYNTGYRKIPEGSVVLDRHEYQRYCAYKIIEPQIKGCLDRERELERKLKELEEQRDRQAYIAEDLVQEKHRWTEQARKETAEKLLNEIKERFVASYLLPTGLDLPAKRVRYAKITEDDLNELAKQYGVEVEE